jgi:hypothetical protein
MNLPIVDKLQEGARKAENVTKEQVEKTRERLEELQDKGREMVERSSETLKTRAERSRRNITLAEAQALDTVGAWIDRAHKATGERAEWLDRGRTFVDRVAQEIRIGNLSVEDLPIDDYDSLGVKAIGEALKDLEPTQRELIHAYEGTHKNRVTVFRTIERLDAQDAS